MRRQSRISGGGALVVRTASALQVWLWLLIFVFQNEFRISQSIQPGYLDFDNLPETNFTCAGKVIGGYYADTETSCQMFHVCTVGAENETMDIKFLCLNGTVFDQETRVCERVDEVDCTKSEKFYSLNLELYGSTLPPVDPGVKPQESTTEQSPQKSKPTQEDSDPSILDSSTSHDKQQGHQPDVVDSTEDPLQEISKEEPQIIHIPSLTQFPEHKDLIVENHEEEIDSDHPEYEEVFTSPPSTTTTQTTSPSTTTTKQPHIFSSDFSSSHPSSGSHLITTPSQILSSLSPPQPATDPPATSHSPSDPSLLSPQEFIYRHRGPSSEAISFQRQSIRPSEGVFITHAPSHQFDPFQYESSRTAPRPTSFVQRPQPFRTTTVDPNNQLLRPGPSSQSSERNPISSNRTPYSSSLPSQSNFPFDPFYYEHKRSDESAAETVLENESFLAARSVAPPTVTERHVPKIKSPPRVIVTASASVSDSNGRRLNYTVGNVVTAVKPSVHINYDDYKESDVDPFFLDVPKLKRRRKSRSNRNKTLIIVPSTTKINKDIVKDKSTTEHQLTQATTTEKPVTTVSTTTVAWNPNDYVDDNYEPHAYVHPVHTVLLDNDRHGNNQVERKLNSHEEDRGRSGVGHVHEIRPTSSVPQTTSSHSTGSGSTSAPSASPPHYRSTHNASLHRHVHH